MSAGIRLATGDWATLGEDASRVRVDVFVREQRIPRELEWDEWDARSLHCVAYLDDVPIATGRLLPDAHIGRMAVLAAHRRSGVGGGILQALIRAARERGDPRVELSAQCYVVAFYERHGFACLGAPYDEVGIPHQRMELRLDGANAEVLVAEHGRRMPDGSRLHQQDWSARGMTGPGVYLLHGLGEHVGRHDALARWFVARGWRVRAHDHVGHGRSSGARGVIERTDQMTEHAAALLEEFSAELANPALLLGHSMGGVLAAELVLGRGVPVSGLIMSSPALATDMSAVQRALVAAMLRLAPATALPNGLDPQQLSHDPQVARAYVADPLVHRRICARLARWIVDAGARARESAAALEVPALLLVAGADTLVAPAGSRAFAQRAPKARLSVHWYDDLRHELFKESEPRRAQVFADMGDWLRRTFG